MAYDRILRAELLRSPRFIRLRHHGARLLFVAFLTEADDFGNLEAEPERLWRFARDFLDLPDPEAGATEILDLCDRLARTDLALPYTVDGIRYLHLPRFRNSRKYFSRRCPPSPWCDPNAATGPYVAGIQQQDRSAFATTLSTRQQRQDPKLSQVWVRPESGWKQKTAVNGHIQQNQPSTGEPESGTVRAESYLTPGVGEERRGFKGLEENREPESDLSQAESDQAGRQDGRDDGPPMPAASRLPDDWQPGDRLIAWAMSFRAGLGKPITREQVLLVAEFFRNYWRGLPGPKAKKLDWNATFRTWVGRVSDEEWRSLSVRPQASQDRPGNNAV